MEVVKMRKENKLGRQISKSLKVKSNYLQIHFLLIFAYLILEQQRNQEGQELLIEAKHAKIPRHHKAILNKSKFKRDLNFYSMFESSSTYILDDFNSLTLYNQKFYNLLKMKPQGSKFKTFKCTCSKSMCDSRYCECFAAGQICSHDCNCKNCKNVDQLRHLQGTNKLGNETMGCRCQKSECLKNYCECFQRGERCDSKCQCKNCLNGF